MSMFTSVGLQVEIASFSPSRHNSVYLTVKGGLIDREGWFYRVENICQAGFIMHLFQFWHSNRIASSLQICDACVIDPISKTVETFSPFL